jgi:DNA modification methylase
MGGGTTIIEAMAAGRRAIGTDLNSLSIFITKVKTTQLNTAEKKALISWAKDCIPQLTYRCQSKDIDYLSCHIKTKNLNLPKARFIKKLIAITLDSITSLPSQNTKDFARCAVLKTGQWALDGRTKSHTSLTQFRAKLSENIYQMLDDLNVFSRCTRKHHPGRPRRKLIETDAALIDKTPIFSRQGHKVDLVVTSPPYPGVHVLYHRWQVDGRRETPAPYWITACQDGQGDSYYNFGSRQQPGLNSYFHTSLRTLINIRRVMRQGAYIVQMLAFSDPENHLPRYLNNMEIAGFKEVMFDSNISFNSDKRIWRTVPNRKWHANLRGKTSASREVTLIHQAI